MRNILVLATSALAYYVLLFIVGAPRWFADTNVLLSLFVFFCVIPLVFGYVTQKYLNINLGLSPWVVLLVPLVSNAIEYISSSFETGGAPMEKAGLVVTFWFLQALFFLIGAYINIKQHKKNSE